MAAASLRALEVRKRLLLDRISLQRAELAAHVRGVQKGVSWLAIGAGAVSALGGVGKLVAAGKVVGALRKGMWLPKIAAGAAALWGLGKAAAGMARQRWLARRGAVDVERR
jgi:hypothetical protein